MDGNIELPPSETLEIDWNIWLSYYNENNYDLSNITE